MDDLRSTKSTDRDPGLGGDCDREGWGIGGRRAGGILKQGGARLIASRSSRHLIGGVVAAVGDSASEGGGQSVFAFFGMNEDGQGMIEGNGNDDFGVSASTSKGEDGVGVCVKVAVVLTWTIGGGEDVDKRGGLGDFFNVSQSCRGKSEAVEMLLTLEDFLLLLSSSGHLW